MLLTLGLVVGAAVTAVAFLIARQALVADRARLAAELAAAVSAQAQLKDSFAALSQEALRDNRQDFLQNAEQLLGPVRETLGRVQTQLAEVDKHREGSYRAVSSQLGQLATTQEQLRRATDGLQSSLRSPNVRGKWGEIQLKRIVELAGMLEQCDFVEKATVTSEQGGRQTPDLIVRLPGNTSIVVDAKVPIDAYLAATNAKSEAERQDLMVAHARQVREHIRTLGGKEYWRQFQPSPEFVVMFLPLEPLLSAAFEHDGTLLEQAASLRVIPATPMTLLALLRAVSYGWSQQQIAKNAEEIQALGRELYDRLATMTEHLEGVGRSIKQAADGYDRFVGSLETKVLPGARRFKELGVTSTKEVGDPEALNLSVRRVRKNELTGSLLDD
jgi:DNA recombination protein RmuC